MIERTARNIAEKQEVIQEIDAILAAKKLEHRIMSLVPFGIIVYTWISFPGFADALYGNATGVIVMTICLGIYAAAFYLGERITEVVI